MTTQNNLERPIMETTINDVTNRIQIFKIFVNTTQIRVFVFDNTVPRITGQRRAGRTIYLNTTDGPNNVDALRRVLNVSKNDLNTFNNLITNTDYDLEDFLSLLRV